MTLSLDVVALGVPEVKEAQAFYAAAFSPTCTDHGAHVDLGLHGTGQVALYGTGALAEAAHAHEEPVAAGFRGYVMSFVVSRPGEVRHVVDAAARAGAKVLQPAKKSLFGAFSAVCQAPDGAVWKVAAPTKKDTGPTAEPPVPTETAALLGVAEPKASKAFYEALGMKADRDYSKYVDFHQAAGACRLGLMPRQVLAKDAGVDDSGAGFPAAVLHHRAASRDAVDTLLAAAAAAGGRITVEPGETGESGGPGESGGAEQAGYSGHFTDPDGFVWKATAA